MKLFRRQTFKVHLVALLLMILPPVPLYYAAQRGDSGWLIALLGLVVVGNTLVLLVG